MTLRGRTLLGSGFHAPVLGAVEALNDALIDIDASGRIARLTRREDPDWMRLRDLARAAGTLETLPPGAILLPGFVDLHIHAPQYPQLGQALDVPLEVWLQKHTFPLEARYADLAFARRAYSTLVDDLIANGTTTALYFATIHEDATRLLADICHARGQRALIGKVAMDHPENCPDFYRDADVATAVEGTRRVIEAIRAMPGNADGRVRPVVTPRFIPACTDPLLEELGALARACSCHIQTHVSESDWEHGYVLARHGRSDTESLDRFGLVTRHAVLAHGTLLGESDTERLKARGAAVAHCPLSNIYFGDAVFPLRAALEKGLRVGLGTDISGGPSASMLDAQRFAIAMARMLDGGTDPALPRARRSLRSPSRVDFRTAFHLATAGGGEALDLPVGCFAPGYHFDALMIDPAAIGGSLRLFDELDSGDGVLQKIVMTANAANIARVWIGGVSVKGA